MADFTFFNVILRLFSVLAFKNGAFDENYLIIHEEDKPS